MRQVKQIVATIAALSLTFALVGCSSDGASEETVPEPITSEEIDAQDIEIVQTGYTVEDGVARYAVVAVNPNEGYIANSVMLSIEGYDESDNMLIGTAATISDMYPNSETAVAGSSRLMTVETENPELVRLNVSVDLQFVTWTKVSDVDTIYEYTVSDENINVDNENTAVVTGNVTTHIPGDTDGGAGAGLSIVAVLFDADGNILCGGTDSSIYFDAITTTADVPDSEEGAEEPPAEVIEPQDVTAEFSITIPDAPKFASFKVYVDPGM